MVLPFGSSGGSRAPYLSLAVLVLSSTGCIGGYYRVDPIPTPVAFLGQDEGNCHTSWTSCAEICTKKRWLTSRCKQRCSERYAICMFPSWQADWSGGDSTARDKAQDSMLLWSDEVCADHLSRILGISDTVNLVSGTTALFTAIATPVVNGIQTKEILAAISAAAGGFRSLWNEEVYGDLLGSTILLAINQARQEYREAILSRRSGATLQDYSPSMALLDVGRYHESCSFYVGLMRLNDELTANEDCRSARQRRHKLRSLIRDLGSAHPTEDGEEAEEGLSSGEGLEQGEEPGEASAKPGEGSSEGTGEGEGAGEAIEETAEATTATAPISDQPLASPNVHLLQDYVEELQRIRVKHADCF